MIDALLSELDTQWNAMVIAKPPMKNGELQQPMTPLPILHVFEHERVQTPTGLGNAYIEKTEWQINGYATTKSACESLVSEIDRIVRAKSISGGWWLPTRLEYIEGGKITAFSFFGETTQFNSV